MVCLVWTFSEAVWMALRLFLFAENLQNLLPDCLCLYTRPQLLGSVHSPIICVSAAIFLPLHQRCFAPPFGFLLYKDVYPIYQILFSPCDLTDPYPSASLPLKLPYVLTTLKWILFYIDSIFAIIYLFRNLLGPGRSSLVFCFLSSTYSVSFFEPATRALFRWYMPDSISTCSPLPYVHRHIW